MELIVTISVISIIAAASAGIIIYLLQLFIYLPRQTTARRVVHEVIDIMTEGESSRRGMRYAAQIQEASSTQFRYIFGYPGNADKRSMRLRLDQSKIRRSYTAFGDPVTGPGSSYGGEEVVPYYAAGSISVAGSQSNPNRIFTYFTADGAQLPDPVPTDQLSTIGRVKIDITATTGTGLFQNWDSSFATTSGVEIREYP